MQVKAAAKKNSKLAITSSFLSNLAFTLPIWLIYSLNELKFTPTLAVFLFMSIWATSAILEIPTGALADRFGRKKIYILGSLLLMLWPMAYVFSVPLPLFFLLCLMSGFGNSLNSGAILPIVHESYKQAGYSEKTYNNFLSNYQVSTFVARALSGLLGAALYTIDPKLPFLAMAMAYLVCAALGFFIDDYSKIDSETKSLKHIKVTLLNMKKSELIASLVAAYILFNITCEAVWTGYQIFFEADGRSTIVIGALFTIIGICSAIGSYTVRHFVSKVHPMRILEVYGLGLLTTTILLWQPNLNLRLLAVIPMGLVSGVSVVVINSVIQHKTDNKYQSTALSVFSFIQYIIYALSSLAFGVMLQFMGLNNTRVVFLISAASTVIFLSLYLRSKKSLVEYKTKLSEA